MGDSLFHSVNENSLVSSHIPFLYVTSHFLQPLSNPTPITPIITRREPILCETIVFLAEWRFHWGSSAGAGDAPLVLVLS